MQACRSQCRGAASDCVGDQAQRAAGDGGAAARRSVGGARRTDQAASVILRPEELQVMRHRMPTCATTFNSIYFYLQLMWRIVWLWNSPEHDAQADLPRLQKARVLALLCRDCKFAGEKVCCRRHSGLCLFVFKGFLLSRYRNICLCHVCSEVRDIYKKTGAWFYKGLPNYELPSHSNGDSQGDERDMSSKVARTTKLGMEIESDEDEEMLEGGGGNNETSKIAKNGSFSSALLKSRNLFNLRLSTDIIGSRLTLDGSSSLPKKSPNTPYSRQTSSSDSQKSANSLQPQSADWESGTPNGHRQRRNSVSSFYSISEASSANETFTMNQSESDVSIIQNLENRISSEVSLTLRYASRGAFGNPFRVV